MRINGLPGATELAIPRATPGRGQTTGFAELFRDTLTQANQAQLNAERLIEAVAAGEEPNPGEVASAVNKADIAFRTMIQIRNKLVEAFQELRQLQV